MRKAIVLGTVLGLGLLAVACNSGGDGGSAAGNSEDRGDRAESSADANLNLSHFSSAPTDATTAEQQRDYVDFEFDYPSDWTVLRGRDAGPGNLVRLHSPLVNGFRPIIVTVGTFTVGSEGEPNQIIEQVSLPYMVEETRRAYDGVEIVATGRRELGGQVTQAVLHEGRAKAGHRSQMVGRADIVLANGRRSGLVLLTEVFEQSGEALDAERIGNTGGLAAVYRSFRLRT